MKIHLGLLCCLGLLSALGCQRVSEDAPDRGPGGDGTGFPPLEVWLKQPVGTVKGMEWPISRATGERLSLAGTDEGRHVTVYFPSGRSFGTDSQTVALSERKGLLKHIQLIPLDRRVNYREAVKTIERIAQELGVQNEPLVKERLALWNAETPDENIGASHSTAGMVEDDIRVWLEAKFDSRLQGWYVVVKLSAPSLLELDRFKDR